MLHSQMQGPSSSSSAEDEGDSLCHTPPFEQLNLSSFKSSPPPPPPLPAAPFPLGQVKATSVPRWRRDGIRCVRSKKRET